MNARNYAALFLLAISGQSALAADERSAPSPQGSLFQFQGTPEEQAACAPDSTKFCKDDIPDTFRVLACLQQNREKLRKSCQKVLESHGQ